MSTPITFAKSFSWMIVFTALSLSPAAAQNVTDIDGNVYGTVQIGNQVWMKQNLKTTRYLDGTAIPNQTDNATWAGLSTGAWANYDNNSANDAVYGKLYNWHAVADGRGLCPQGWRVPSDADWSVLGTHLGAGAGTKMKATSGWTSGNGTDESAFTALPAGYRHADTGAFEQVGASADYWSSSEGDDGGAWGRYLKSASSDLTRFEYDKAAGISVRCVRDVDPLSGHVTDLDGNVYGTVQIGNQVWMKQNLKTTQYKDGTAIPNETDNGVWAGLSTGAWAYYDNNSANDAVYGKLYNWYAVADGRGLCPDGWRVPSDSDWSQLETHLGGISVAAGKLKATGTDYWTSPNTGATNESGFTALPGGRRLNDGTFGSQRDQAYIWSSSSIDATVARYRLLYFQFAGQDRYGFDKKFGMAVRCMRDVAPASVAGSDGFRLLSAPRSGQILQELLEPIWTQGMTEGGDVSSGSPNVWVFDDDAVGDWVAVTNLTTQEVAAGQGILVYVFADTDYSGGEDTLPATLSVATAGTANSADVTVSGVADGEWVLAGNPYAIPLDWDELSKSGLSSSIHVYDHGTTWRAWNGATGELTGGVIAPYQGFFIQGSGGGGSVTFSQRAEAGSAGTFYKQGASQGAGQEEGSASTAGSLALTLSVDAGENADRLQDRAFLSFGADGQVGQDSRDALKLMPFSVRERALLLLEGTGTETHAGGAAGTGGTSASTWSIAHLPWDGAQTGDGSTLALPLQAMHLLADAEQGHVPAASRARLSWDAEALPPHVSVSLRDRRTGGLTPLTGSGETWLQTLAGEPIARVEGEGIPSYRPRGDAGWELVVGYAATSVSVDPGPGGEGGYGFEFPSSLTLAPNYPNPFNPSTQIRFGLPSASRNVTLHVYDVAGRRVATLLDAQALPAGWHEVRFDASGLASGVYVYTLRVSGSTLTRAFTLTR